MARTKEIVEDADDLPEGDRLLDFSHPRETADFYGHAGPEETLLGLIRKAQLPHGFLITGPRGIGKATLAYRLARFVLKHGVGTQASAQADSLYVAPDDPVFRRVAALGHGDLLVVRRGYNTEKDRLKSEVSVDEARRTAGFFSKTAGEGGWRIAIVDCFDEMNMAGANALLKILEEPPQRSLLLLIAHSKGLVLPTIRSRCRVLDLNPLAKPDILSVLKTELPEIAPKDSDLIADLSEGSAGRALSLAAGDGTDIYRTMMGLLTSLPKLDLKALHALADRLSGRDGEESYRLAGEILSEMLARALKAQVLQGDEGGIELKWLKGRRLDRAAALWEKINQLFARAEERNLDRKQTVLTVFEEIASFARA